MSEQLRKAFFEDLAGTLDYARRSAGEAITSGVPPWAQEPAHFERLRQALGGGDDAAAFAAAVTEFVAVAVHSVLVAINGGSASAEVGRLSLVDEDGVSVGEGLHELFNDYLFETGRIE